MRVPSAAPATDGFSVTSLTSLCSSIANRAASSAGELDTLGAARPGPILALAEHIRQIGRGASQLEQALDAAPAISQQLQHVLGRALATGDAATGRLHKQVMRLRAENLAAVDADYAEAYGRFLETYSRLFAYFSDALSMNDRAQQDAHINSTEGLEVIGQSIAITATSQPNSILLDGGKAPDPSSLPLRPRTQPGDDEPPPYIAPAPASSSNTPRAGPSSGGGLSSFAQSIKAFVANFAPRPDPLASALCQAVLRGDTQQVSGLLAQGAGVGGRNEDGRTPLQCAIAGDRDEAARLLLAAGASAGGSGGGWSGAPPLFQAASAGSLRVAQVLLDRGAEVGEASLSGEPYFVGVCEGGSLAGVDFLLRRGAKPTWRSVSGRPVLVQAVRKGNVELAELLLDHGADANCSDITGSPVLALATEKADLALARLLLDRGAEPNAGTVYGSSVLADALSRKRLDAARLLLDRGAEGDTADLYGQPLLICVIKDAALTGADKTDLARRLLANGAPANAKDMAWGRPAICHALEAGLTDTVALLLGHGAETACRMSSGATLLLHAVDHGRRDEAKALLEHGADANGADGQGRTPLMQALARQDADMVRLLREHGAGSDASRPGTMELLGVGGEAPSAPAGGSRPGAAGAGRPGRAESPPPGYDVAMKS